ncbi:nesprin-3 isoform X2 [Syngnathus acus]|uniref:nesprin-3 isoform X2 n=1 Tax=Syngnathus acus TaxID=161584 RepID=UPI00188637C4|nr:nesprin-3 isoform X2 [Syngnathus acus]
MTEQEQRTFTERLEAALSWMKAAQERLRANDNTQGPRNALEARLRETEKIHQSEHDGRVKMEMALVAAEHLLETGEEGVKSHIHAKLKELKSCWEETCTYIIHCHSRIEWVWLHWSEYLKALREFESWLAKQQCHLDVGVPLQVGLKEKLWQADQQRVALSDVHGQAALIKRLLDEAAVLHDRTRDPSVDSRAREGLQQAYDDLKDKVEDRLALLQGMAEEHRTYRGSVERFQSWLLSKTKELTDLMEKEDTSENKIQALKALDDMVASEEKTLQHIEAAAEGVRVQTCPAGAELVVDEAEELRLGWQRLRQGLCEVEEGLRSTLDTHGDYTARCRRLQDDVGSLRTRLRELERELEDPRGAEFSEAQMMDQWRRYTDVREALAAEESQVERLKSQLKELFGFSEDSRHISDDVLAVVREHQSVKCKAAKLCSESECSLRKTLEDTLLFFARWRDMVSQVLEASAEVTDLSHILQLLQNIERLVKDSIQLQERLNQLQTRGDRLQSLFDPKRSDALRSELSSATRNRELLHDQLIQRKGRLEAFISSTKDFEEASVVIGSKLSSLRDAMMATVGLQPDILAKKSQSQQFRVIQKELEDCEAHITALETLVSSCPSKHSRFEKLYRDWKYLNETIEANLHKCEENIGHHANFHERFLNLEKWLTIAKQKLESFKSPTGEWSIEKRQHEAQKTLGEFPEKEIQLHQLEMQAQTLLKRTSEEGRVHIEGDMTRLQGLWLALYTTSLNIHRLVNGSINKVDSGCFGQTEDLAVLPGLQQAGHHHQQQHHHHHHQHQQPLAEDSTVDTNVNSDAASRGALWPASDEESPEEKAPTMESLGQGEGAFRLFTQPPTKQQASTMMDEVEFEYKRTEFEAWLCKENELLSGILNSKGATLKGNQLKIQQETLNALRSRVTWGQEHFQLLLQGSAMSKSGSGSAADASLEELRYRWMLYKSKLKAVVVPQARLGSKKITHKLGKPATGATLYKKPGLLQRVCRLALPLWLLFLALLLLAFLLPLVDKGESCSISNNFARSFSVMLRYSGPPPT